MGQLWTTAVAYLFQQPGTTFSYYTPFLVAIGFVVVWGGYHYLLEARRRFRHHAPIQSFLDTTVLWMSILAGVAAIVLLARHSDAPVISWRIWMYVYSVAVAVVFVLFLGRLYRRLPKVLAAHDNELLKRSYLAPANQRQVANASSRRQSGSRG